MFRKVILVPFLLIIGFAIAVFPQTEKAPAKSKASPKTGTPAKTKGKSSAKAPVDQKAIEAAIQAHVRDYLNDETIPQEDLKIAAVNDSEFKKLRYRVSIMGGAVRYYRGRPIPEEGSIIIVSFVGPSDGSDSSGDLHPQTAFTINGTADGNSGIKTIDGISITEGTSIQFKTGEAYVFRSEKWARP